MQNDVIIRLDITGTWCDVTKDSFFSQCVTAVKRRRVTVNQSDCNNIFSKKFKKGVLYTWLERRVFFKYVLLGIAQVTIVWLIHVEQQDKTERWDIIAPSMYECSKMITVITGHAFGQSKKYNSIINTTDSMSMKMIWSNMEEKA